MKKRIAWLLLSCLTVVALVLTSCGSAVTEEEEGYVYDDTELPPSSFLPEIPRINAEEVKAKSDAGVNLVIIDSRSETSYARSHITGAISIPLFIMAEPYSGLDSYDEIITYCG